MTPDELHYLYMEAIRTMPPFENSETGEPLTRAQVAWQARAVALIELQGHLSDVNAFSTAMTRSRSSMSRAGAGLSFFQLLTTAATREELKMAPGARGTFIPLGDHFDALRAITDVLQGAANDLLIVDPYADDSILHRFARSANEGVRIRVLRDSRYQEIGAKLLVAKDAWIRQFGNQRPLEIRSAPRGALHDRFISQDSQTVFLVSQSLKDLAERSPATIQKTDQHITDEKIAAYEALWQAAAIM